MLLQDERKFLEELMKWTGVATPAELGPQLSQKDNSLRQRCKIKGYVTFDKHYWRITELGKEALKEKDLFNNSEHWFTVYVVHHNYTGNWTHTKEYHSLEEARKVAKEFCNTKMSKNTKYKIVKQNYEIVEEKK